MIDEASGTIVMGANVRISTVAIAQGNLTIRVTETPEVSQPGPFSNGTTVVVPRTQIQVDDQHDRKLGILQRQRDAARPGGQPERARRRAARHDQHPAIDQGGRRVAGRPGGALMTAHCRRPAARQLLAAGAGPRKLWQAAQDFEAMALGELLQPMFETVDTAHAAVRRRRGREPPGGRCWSMRSASRSPRMADWGSPAPVFNAMLRAQEQTQ